MTKEKPPERRKPGVLFRCFKLFEYLSELLIHFNLLEFYAVKASKDHGVV